MRFERRLKPQVNVDLTPLIDVVLQLIIFFMISSVFKTAPGIDMDLPDSGTARSVALTEVTLTLVNDQEIFVNKRPADLVTLDAVLKSQIGDTVLEELSVTLEGNSAVSYQTLVSVLDVLRANGIEGVNLRTDGPPRTLDKP